MSIGIDATGHHDRDVLDEIEGCLVRSHGGDITNEVTRNDIGIEIAIGYPSVDHCRDGGPYGLVKDAVLEIGCFAVGLVCDVEAWGNAVIEPTNGETVRCAKCDRGLANGLDLLAGSFEIGPGLDRVNVNAGLGKDIFVVYDTCEVHVERKDQCLSLVVGDRRYYLTAYVCKEIQIVHRHEVLAVSVNGPTVGVEYIWKVVCSHLGLHELLISLTWSGELHSIAALNLECLNGSLHYIDLCASSADPHRNSLAARLGLCLRKYRNTANQDKRKNHSFLHIPPPSVQYDYYGTSKTSLCAN